MLPDLAGILKQFQLEGELVNAERIDSGHINDSYAVQFRHDSHASRRYLLQRINHHVFASPEKLMENVESITEHLRTKILAAGGNPQRETMTLIPTTEGQTLCQTPAAVIRSPGDADELHGRPLW